VTITRNALRRGAAKENESNRVFRELVFFFFINKIFFGAKEANAEVKLKFWTTIGGSGKWTRSRSIANAWNQEETFRTTECV